MKFDVLITHFGNSKARAIVSKHIAHEAGVSIQVALSRLDVLPVTYASGVSKDEASLYVRQLEKISVAAHIAEVQPAMPQQHSSYLADKPAPKHEPLQQPPEPQPVHKQEPPQPVPEPAATRKIEPVRKRSSVLWLSGAILGVLVFAFAASRGVFNWRHAFDLDWSKSGLTSGDSPAHKKPDPSKKPGSQDTEKKPDSTASDSANRAFRDSLLDSLGFDSAHVRTAEAFLDSARNAETVKGAISFYKFAISFNRKNVAAWRGIRDAYGRAGMDEEKARTENEMTKRFGDAVFSVAAIIDQYGSASSLSADNGGTMRMEYRAKKQDANEALLDAFHLMRDLKQSCNCSAISLYARTGNTSGVLVYARMESLPVSFDRFRDKASVTVLR